MLPHLPHLQRAGWADCPMPQLPYVLLACIACLLRCVLVCVCPTFCLRSQMPWWLERPARVWACVTLTHAPCCLLRCACPALCLSSPCCPALLRLPCCPACSACYGSQAGTAPGVGSPRPLLYLHLRLWLPSARIPPPSEAPAVPGRGQHQYPARDRWGIRCRPAAVARNPRPAGRTDGRPPPLPLPLPALPV